MLLHNTMSLLFSYRKRSFSTFSRVNLDLLSLRRLPVELNKRSLGTLVAVIHRNHLAKVDKNVVNFTFFPPQQWVL